MTRSTWTRLGRIAATAVALVTALAGCATNPASGRQQFSLLTPQQEASIGQREYPRLVEQFGGVYDDPALTAYVERVGRSVVQATGSANEPYRFTVLDSDRPNAFALPGGYVSVTRGLLALMNDEAELAGVISHEVAHVTARHSAERYSQATIAQLGASILGAATGSDELAELAGSGAQIYLLSYSRGQESEADAIGIRYLAASGYDPFAMSSFLQQLDRESDLDALIDGRSEGAGLPAYLSSHPRTEDRVRQAGALAARSPGQSVRRNRDSYLSAIDGLIWGESGDYGFIEGTVLTQPAEGVRWEAPRGFRLGHSGARVIGSDGRGSQIVYDVVSPRQSASPARYLADEWARDTVFQDFQSLNINGYDAATGSFQISTRAGLRDVRMVAIRSDQNRIARFAFLTPPERTAQMTTAFQRTTFSFRPLSRSEQTAQRPRRVDIVTVRRGDTSASLAGGMAFEDYRLERFLALNGLDTGAPLRPGQRVKLIVR